MAKKWWDKGIRFECQGSGKCCLSHGQYGFVYLTLKDRKRIAKHLGLSTSAFTRKYCKKNLGHFCLDEGKRSECQFLSSDKKCGIYEARPTQCRTWPFWPELMGAKGWKKEVAAFCPGVGKGSVIPSEKIDAILREQIQADS